MKTLSFFIYFLGVAFSLFGQNVVADDRTDEARANQCDGRTPIAEGRGGRQFRITCLKTCPINGKTEYLYLVEDVESKFGKNNDKFRFKLVQSPLWAGFRGPYGEQRILNRNDGLKCTADRDPKREAGKLDFSGDGSASRQALAELLKESATCGEKESASIKGRSPRSELDFSASQKEIGIQASNCPGGNPTTASLSRDKIKENGKGNFKFVGKKGNDGFSCAIKNDLPKLKALASTFLAKCDGLKSSNSTKSLDSQNGNEPTDEDNRRDDKATQEP